MGRTVRFACKVEREIICIGCTIRKELLPRLDRDRIRRFEDDAMETRGHKGASLDRTHRRGDRDISERRTIDEGGGEDPRCQRRDPIGANGDIGDIRQLCTVIAEEIDRSAVIIYARGIDAILPPEAHRLRHQQVRTVLGEEGQVTTVSLIIDRAGCDNLNLGWQGTPILDLYRIASEDEAKRDALEGIRPKADDALINGDGHGLDRGGTGWDRDDRATSVRNLRCQITTVSGLEIRVLTLNLPHAQMRECA